jgi:hypothetical protein
MKELINYLIDYIANDPTRLAWSSLSAVSLSAASVGGGG